MLWVSESTAHRLLRYYDYPHPDKPGEIIEGYDKNHALRTAKMCGAVASCLGHEAERVRQFQIACLLHDLGRAGLDQKLFGKIWTWAQAQGIPTRPAEWRAQHPETIYGKETEAFWSLHCAQLREIGVESTAWAREQVEMRLGYARRLRRRIRKIKPGLKRLGIQWSGWMELVVMYYYYPEKLDGAPAWIRELGEILMACEQLEAYSNRSRGSDYYDRETESFAAAFAYLDNLRDDTRLSSRVLAAVRKLTGQGLFDAVLAAARNGRVSEQDLAYLRSLDNPGSG